MSEIVYKSLSSLSPVELKYKYSREEKLNSNFYGYKEGLYTNIIEGLNQFQDVTINKKSCLLLTNTIYLSSLFKQPEVKALIKKYPVSVKISSRSNPSKYISYDEFNGVFLLSENNPCIFYLNPIKETNQIEILLNGNYVQVRAEYPYNLYLQKNSLDPEEIERQRFYVDYQNNFISFKTSTTSGLRYLCFNVDNILRATGCLFNSHVINDYVFQCELITNNKEVLGFKPTNNWVSYFSDNLRLENKTVDINKNESNILTNFLLDFPVEKATNEGIGYINAANLKTHVNPVGHPASI